MLDRDKCIHMIGVGGIGMSALAQVYADLGYRVTGSDRKESAILQRLRSHGVDISIGHAPANVSGADLVVCSTAVGEDNPERAAAVSHGIEVWKRAQLLSDVLSSRTSIVATGCHGKTTTSAMMTWVMEKLGLDPVALLGGEIGPLGGNALCGAGRFIVAEADESDRSFLYLNPDIAVVTNVDFDHPDFYRDMDDVMATYSQFIERVRSRCVLCFEDEPTRLLAAKARCPVMSYGFSDDLDIRGVDWQETPDTHSAVVWEGKSKLGRLYLQLTGRHNMLNALAVVTVMRLLGLDFKPVAEALQAFPGTRRRMEFKGEKRGVRVFDDYAHHPTEVRAALESFKNRAPGRKIVVFQPHRYSRTQRFAGDFARALDPAEVLIVTGIYSAGDTPIPGVSGKSIFDLLSQKHIRYYCETQDECLDQLLQVVQPGDTVITCGAGTIYHVGEQLLERLG